MTGTFRPQTAKRRSSFRTDLKEGFRWLWNHQLLRRFAIVLGLLNAIERGHHRDIGPLWPRDPQARR